MAIHAYPYFLAIPPAAVPQLTAIGCLVTTITTFPSSRTELCFLTRDPGF